MALEDTWPEVDHLRQVEAELIAKRSGQVLCRIQLSRMRTASIDHAKHLSAQRLVLGGAAPLHERPAVWMSSAQHAWRPPSRSSHPRPPQWPHAAGQQAATPCLPGMLPAGHSGADATKGSVTATASKRRTMVWYQIRYLGA